jgi:site-specific DNA recombinase
LLVSSDRVIVRNMRILGVVRLSHLTEVTTSPGRQREYPQKWAAVHGGEVVAIAEDLGVSGSVSPFERPGLGPWLSDNPPEPWDVLVAWRLDRVGRNALDTLLLLQWLEARGKRLVTVADGLDTAGPMAKAFITLAAVFAEMERTVMVERAREGKAALKAAGRWSGGRVTYGHRVEQGFLVEDPHKATVVRRMAEWADDGWNSARIARKLNEDGEPAPLRGEWGRWSVKQLLTNPALVGLGSPPAPAILDAELFRRIGDKLQGPAPLRAESPELSGVLVCLTCGEKLWHRRQRNPNRTMNYWSCRTKGHTLSISGDVAVELAIIEFVSAFGAEPVYREITHPDTTADELARAWVELEQVNAEYSTPGADRPALRARRNELEEHIERLEARPPQVDRVERIDTGRTWAEEVDRLPLEELGDELRQRGMRIGIRKTQSKPEEIEVRVLA